MKRKKLNPVSDKRKAQNLAAAGLRRHLVFESRGCELCGYSSHHHNPAMPVALSKLACHEIYNGASGRSLSLDKPYALLVLCQFCNQHLMTDKGLWPESRQLCLLKLRSPARYDLGAYNKLVNPRAPNRTTQSDVDAWKGSIPPDLTQLPSWKQLRE